MINNNRFRKVSNNQFKEMINSVDSNTVIASNITSALVQGHITGERVEKIMKVLNKCKAFSIVVPNEYLKFVKANYFTKLAYAPGTRLCDPTYKDSVLIHSHEK
jgi:hypothetical protein